MGCLDGWSCQFFPPAFDRQLLLEFCNLLIQSFDGETDPRVLLNGFKVFAAAQEAGLPGDENHSLWDELLGKD